MYTHIVHQKSGEVFYPGFQVVVYLRLVLLYWLLKLTLQCLVLVFETLHRLCHRLKDSNLMVIHKLQCVFTATLLLDGAWHLVLVCFFCFHIGICLIVMILKIKFFLVASVDINPLFQLVPVTSLRGKQIIVRFFYIPREHVMGFIAGILCKLWSCFIECV